MKIGLFSSERGWDHMCTPNDLEKLLKKIVIIYRDIYRQDLCDIYLYGSYARGDYTNESDIDIVAIVKGERQKIQDQLKKIWDIVSDLELDYEAVSYTHLRAHET